MKDLRDLKNLTIHDVKLATNTLQRESLLKLKGRTVNLRRRNVKVQRGFELKDLRNLKDLSIHDAKPISDECATRGVGAPLARLQGPGAAPRPAFSAQDFIFWLRVCGLALRVWGSGLRVWGLGFRV